MGAAFHEDAIFFDTIRVRSKEGMALDIDLVLSYTLTTSNDDKVKASQLWEIY